MRWSFWVDWLKGICVLREEKWRCGTLWKRGPASDDFNKFNPIFNPKWILLWDGQQPLRGCKASQTQGAPWLDRIRCGSVSVSAEKGWKQKEDIPITLAGDQWLPRDGQAPTGLCEVMHIMCVIIVWDCFTKCATQKRMVIVIGV